jgi:uncharacterized protein YbaP (TraB family)
VAFTPTADEARSQTVEALNRGDDAAMLRLLRRLSVSEADFQIVLRLLITERNLAWLPALMRYADEGRALINVGAADLPGPGWRGRAVAAARLPRRTDHRADGTAQLA